MIYKDAEGRTHWIPTVSAMITWLFMGICVLSMHMKGMGVLTYMFDSKYSTHFWVISFFLYVTLRIIGAILRGMARPFRGY